MLNYADEKFYQEYGVNNNMWKRLQKMFNGFLSLFIKGLEVNNPQALIEAEKESLREKVALFNKNLAKQAGFISRLDLQIVGLAKQEADLMAKTTAHLKAGNNKLAGEYALQLQDVKKQLTENKQQRIEAEDVYRNLIKTRDVTVKEAREKIELIVRKLSQVEMKEAEADLREMAAGMISSVGSDGDTLNRLDEALSERLQDASGKARVAKDSMDTTEVEMKNSERDALGQQALAAFAASQGLEFKAEEMAAPVIEQPAQKAMGPIEEKIEKVAE